MLGSRGIIALFGHSPMWTLDLGSISLEKPGFTNRSKMKFKGNKVISCSQSQLKRTPLHVSIPLLLWEQKWTEQSLLRLESGISKGIVTPFLQPDSLSHVWAQRQNYPNTKQMPLFGSVKELRGEEPENWSVRCNNQSCGSLPWARFPLPATSAEIPK